ncbi:kinase-like protein [Sanghuangporus baumii]|uniref:Kinase-like protein n=1 Tax=Sanghuangporus baumii TaxID=108892 RepID=A0A9Q5HXL4_SANBA|nr:kinase-like protein [Sanghuangporus baumii]
MTVINGRPASEPILSLWDNEELRRLEERSENPYLGMLHALLDMHSELDLTGKIHGIDNARSIPGGYSDIVYGYCTGPDGVDYKVAVKKLRLHVMDDRDFQKRLTKELYIWSKLNNRRILPLEGFFLEDNNCPSLVSRWMENGTALNYLEAHPDVDLLRLVTGIAEGITYLHLNGIVHSDIKPDNVLVSEFGEPLLCDFGVSRMVVASRSFNFSSSLSGGGLRGTLRFMSKELLQASDISPATYSRDSDVWAFGMTVLSILTKKVPYHYINNDVQVITAISKGLVPSAPSDLDSWPLNNQLLWRLCTFCWKPVADRHSMQTFVLELQLLEDALFVSDFTASTYHFRFLERNPSRSGSSRNQPDSFGRYHGSSTVVRRQCVVLIVVLVFLAIAIPIVVLLVNKA